MKLTKKDKKMIVEALLFYSCTDMCSDITEKKAKEFYKFTKKFANEYDITDLQISDLYLMKPDEVIYETKTAKKIIKDFTIKLK